MIPQRYIDRFYKNIWYAPAPDGVIGDCWLWQGAKMGTGYGAMGVKLDESIKGRTYGTHVFAYMLLIGEPPKGCHLDHLCKIKNCCNPYHLEPVTASVNLMRARNNYSGVPKHPKNENAISRVFSPTHCPRGHPYAGDNLKPSKDGLRRCRICVNQQNRERYQRQKISR